MDIETERGSRYSPDHSLSSKQGRGDRQTCRHTAKRNKERQTENENDAAVSKMKREKFRRVSSSQSGQSCFPTALKGEMCNSIG
jgi:hypothetical protein